MKVSLGFSWLALIKPGGEKGKSWKGSSARDFGLVFLCSLFLSLSPSFCSLSVSLLAVCLAEWGTCCVLYGPSVTYSALPSAWRSICITSLCLRTETWRLSPHRLLCQHPPTTLPHPQVPAQSTMEAETHSETLHLLFLLLLSPFIPFYILCISLFSHPV